MDMLRRSALAALLLVALTASSAEGASRQRDRCHLPGVRTVALTKQLRVFQSDENGYYYGCHRRTGRQTELWEQDDLYTTGAVRRVAGRFVLYSSFTSPGCKADCPPEARSTHITAVTDVRSGRTRDLHDGVVYAAFLRASGTVAWIAEARPESQLSMWTLGGPATLLDTGDIQALRAANGTLRWANSDGPHAVSFS
jgi:hypothetical protein